MKKVLFIAYYFPPIGGGGVTRPLKFFNYLPQYNWQPSVLTVKSKKFRVNDPQLETQIVNKKNVHRTVSFTPFELLNYFTGKKQKQVRNTNKINQYRKLAAFFCIPDVYIGWLPFALWKGISLMRKEKFDLIFATSPPPTTLIIGMILSRLFKIPLVADFRDLWVNEYFYNPPTFFHHKLHKYLELKVVKSAELITCISESMEKFLKKQYDKKISTDKIRVVSNGFDANDFNNSFPLHKNDKRTITITHTGSLTLTRTIEPLAIALKKMIVDENIKPGDLKIILVGRRDDINDKIIRDYQLEEIFELKSSVSHQQAIKMQAISDILLLVGNKVRHELNNIVLTGKIFEYLASNNPIFGIIPKNSESAKLINTANAGITADIYDVNDIKEKLLFLITNFRNGGLKFKTDTKYIENFEYKRLTSELAGLFDSVPVE